MEKLREQIITALRAELGNNFHTDIGSSKTAEQEADWIIQQIEYGGFELSYEDGETLIDESPIKDFIKSWTSEHYLTTGDLIKNAREASGMSVRKLTAALGYKSASIISQWENGVRIPKYQSLKKIGDILGKTPNALMGDDDIRDFESYIK